MILISFNDDGGGGKNKGSKIASGSKKITIIISSNPILI